VGKRGGSSRAGRRCAVAGGGTGGIGGRRGRAGGVGGGGGVGRGSVGGAVGVGVDLDALQTAQVGSEAGGGFDLGFRAGGEDAARDFGDDRDVAADAANVKGPAGAQAVAKACLGALRNLAEEIALGERSGAQAGDGGGGGD